MARALFFLLLTLLFLVHPTAAKAVGFSLKLIPMDIISSFASKNLSKTDQMKLVESSKARADYLEVVSNPSANKINFLVNRFNSGLYAVKVVLGERRETRMLQMDTSTGLVWTQCAPCVHCFNQSDPIFNGNQSSTYRKIPSKNSACRTPPYRRANGQCLYGLKYGRNAITQGFLSQETFWLPYKNTLVPKQNMVFGCSNDNINFNFDRLGKVSGILGMSRAPESFVKQLDNVIGGRFSYCLVGISNTKRITTSLLSFGSDAYLPSNAISTPIVPVSNNQNYYLNLNDISVAGNRIGFPPGTFSLKRDGTGGCIIDTGTVATLIAPSAYSRVIETFQKYFQPFNLRKVRSKTNQGFEVCFEMKRTFTQYPPMTFHFQAADLVVKPQFLHFFDMVANYSCVALLKGNTKTILGSMHQQDVRFVYDLKNNALNFAPENC
ncbi:aspartic proteinase nepenthesin-2-like [Actinidia eriantha]|uniref:aspartic proteinase nepenthesin-2-like n=1 Tax=Actinidia eriantha TaxID=165200 RepID=UPI00258D10F6|nr:aspartic proteinase nepenthesin-2-like [Actinidia eriantha]